MSKYGYPEVRVYGQLTNDSAVVDIIAGSESYLSGSTTQATMQYLCVEKLTYSVHKPAKDGGGKWRFQDAEGNYFWETDVNGVKEISLDFGEDGMPWPFDTRIQTIVHGAAGDQASLWFSLVGHTDSEGITT